MNINEKRKKQSRISTSHYHREKGFDTTQAMGNRLAGPISVKSRIWKDIITDASKAGKAVSIGWLYEAFDVPDNIHKVLSCFANQPDFGQGHVEILWKDGNWDDWDDLSRWFVM